jgi:hypothetical protein
MFNQDKNVTESIALDAAYLKGSVTGVIDDLAQAAAEEVERARDYYRDAGREDDATVV